MSHGKGRKRIRARKAEVYHEREREREREYMRRKSDAYDGGIVAGENVLLQHRERFWLSRRRRRRQTFWKRRRCGYR
jgi:hypothetical protein